jgi:hypothetical protein
VVQCSVVQCGAVQCSVVGCKVQICYKKSQSHIHTHSHIHIHSHSHTSGNEWYVVCLPYGTSDRGHALIHSHTLTHTHIKTHTSIPAGMNGMSSACHTARTTEDIMSSTSGAINWIWDVSSSTTLNTFARLNCRSRTVCVCVCVREREYVCL